MPGPKKKPGSRLRILFFVGAGILAVAVLEKGCRDGGFCWLGGGRKRPARAGGRKMVRDDEGGGKGRGI